MKRSISRRRVWSATVLATALGWAGCVDGDISHRDDGKAAALATSSREAPAYTAEVNEAAARLLRDHPGMSPQEAYAQARANAMASYELTGPTRTEREQAEAQDKFEDELAKLDP